MEEWKVSNAEVSAKRDAVRDATAAAADKANGRGRNSLRGCRIGAQVPFKTSAPALIEVWSDSP